MASSTSSGATAAARIKVFLPDAELVWVKAEVIGEVKPGHYEVEITDPERPSSMPARSVITMSSLCRQMDTLPLQNENVGEDGVPDMVNLNYLHEASILENLRLRFKASKPYTYVGIICIAINPYRWFPQIYTEQMQDQYAGVMENRRELEPHVYSTSALAYRDLSSFSRPQSILVSGESGAGKTETVKIMLSHIAHVSGKKGDSTVQRILEANPLLESFGNAKTVRNDNSSRFGKFIELQFSKHGANLCGSKCCTYLLEKSRVVAQSPGERNFHIFYQLFAAPREVRTELLQLQDDTRLSDFSFLCRGDTTTTSIEGVEDSSRYMETIQTLQHLGFSLLQIQELQKLLMGVVFLGQISFLGDVDISFIDPSKSAITSSCCHLFGLNTATFYEKTTVRRIEAGGREGGGSMVVNLSREQAADGRDALAKDVYDRVFQWIVQKVNRSTCASHAALGLDPSVDLLRSNAIMTDRSQVVALLDIFGFEVFKVNRFEQLCINFANEKLQQKFTQDVFAGVQNEYKEEGLEWSLVDYNDNAGVLDLLEGRLGLITLLNEECQLPQGADLKFLSKLVNTHGNGKSAHFAHTVAHSKEEFAIHHYAGSVVYNVTSFVERNKDALPSEVYSLMSQSTNSILSEIYSVDSAQEGETPPVRGASPNPPPHPGSKGGQGRKSFMKADSVTTKFRSQLTQLMDAIRRTAVQYVRCIKPNSVKSSEKYSRPLVTSQLRCAGMIEAIRISRAAYPYRLSHSDFVARFSDLRSKAWMRRTNAIDDASKCRALLEEVVPEGSVPTTQASTAHGKVKRKMYEIGRTRVYFSAGVLEFAEGLRSQLVNLHARVLQSLFRFIVDRARFLRCRGGAVLLQAAVRGAVARRIFVAQVAALVKIQSFVRGLLLRRRIALLHAHAAASAIQSLARMARERKSYKRLLLAAARIQSFFKRRLSALQSQQRAQEAQATRRLDSQLRTLKQRLSYNAVSAAAAGAGAGAAGAASPKSSAPPAGSRSRDLGSSSGSSSGSSLKDSQAELQSALAALQASKADADDLRLRLQEAVAESAALRDQLSEARGALSAAAASPPLPAPADFIPYPDSSLGEQLGEVKKELDEARQLLQSERRWFREQQEHHAANLVEERAKLAELQLASERTRHKAVLAAVRKAESEAFAQRESSIASMQRRHKEEHEGLLEAQRRALLQESSDSHRRQQEEQQQTWAAERLALEKSLRDELQSTIERAVMEALREAEAVATAERGAMEEQLRQADVAHAAELARVTAHGTALQEAVVAEQQQALSALQREIFTLSSAKHAALSELAAAQQELTEERANATASGKKLAAQAEAERRERDKDALAMIERLEADLHRFRLEGEAVRRDNEHLREDLKREAGAAEVRSGKLALSRAALEAAEKDLETARAEKAAAVKMSAQYKLEKSHAMDNLLQLGAELDELHGFNAQMLRCVPVPLFSPLLFSSRPSPTCAPLTPPPTFHLGPGTYRRSVRCCCCGRGRRLTRWP